MHVEFVIKFETVPLTYQKITSFDVSIRIMKEMPKTLRKAFLEVVCSSRFVYYSNALFGLYLIFCKTYSSIFISPSSSESFDDEDENGSARKKQRTSTSQRKATKCNVANILGMNGQVTPRSIAYAAVLVCQCKFYFILV